MYALGLGLGSDPVDATQLRFVQESGLAALPTLATVLAPRFGWLYRTGVGIDSLRCVHAEQSLCIHRPLPAAGEVIGDLTVTDLVDKGPGAGAVVYFQRRLWDARDGALLATLDAAVFCRGQGGFSGSRDAPASAPAMPERAPDARWSWPTFAQQAIWYRQSGDRNPIHSDPAVARAAGFERPVLHGLCSYGIAAFVLLRERLNGDPTALRRLRARFVSPFYPGETLLIECWDEPRGLRFRCRSLERGVLVLDRGELNGQVASA